MKKITFYFFFITACICAQSTYNTTDFAQINEEFIVSRTSANLQTLNFVETGTNFSWDYSSLSASTQETVTWDDPNASGYKTTWCLLNGYFGNCNSQFNTAFNLSNQASQGIQFQDYGLTNIVNHYQLNAMALQNKMMGASVSISGVTIPYTVDYENPDVVYELPMNYNDNYTNIGNFEIDLSTFGVPITYTSQIERTNIVEGWGSLVTPFGTFDDVLKMKTTVVQNDVITTQTETIPTTRTTITYKWFDTDYGIPVFQVTGEMVSEEFVPTSASYIDSPQCLDPSALFSYLPIVPDYDYDTASTSVSFLNLSSNYDDVEWDFGDGSTSSEENPTHVFTCPGVQQITLTVTNLFCDPDLTDTIVIPLFINDPDGTFTTAVTQTDTSLTAERDTEGTTYQWVDCTNGNAEIDGETQQVFMPTVDGNYAVVLTTNGCESMSECYSFSVLGIETFNLDAQISLYPNPSQTEIFIKKPEGINIEKIAILNTLGQKVGANLYVNSLSTGIYYVQLDTNKGAIIKKIIKN